MTQNRPARPISLPAFLTVIGIIAVFLLGSMLVAHHFAIKPADAFDVRVLDCGGNNIAAVAELQITNKTDKDLSAKVEVEFRDLYGRKLAEASKRADISGGDVVLTKAIDLMGDASQVRSCNITSVEL